MVCRHVASFMKCALKFQKEMPPTLMLLGLIVFTTTFPQGGSWTYVGPDGENYWYKHYPFCGGVFQSPINIKSELLRYDSSLTPVEVVNYDLQGYEQLTLSNNGHSVQLNLPMKMSLLGLPYRYSASQLHLHWGSPTFPSGSEHTVNGVRFPAEMHVVHFNSDKYANISVAMDQSDGLAVLGVLIEEGSFNPAFDRFLAYINEIKYTNQTVHIPAFNIRDLLPEHLGDYYRYDGSLTTPPCYPSVLWTVFRTPVSISHTQFMALATSMYSSSAQDTSTVILNRNYRGTQSIDDRTVLVSFQDGKRIQALGEVRSPFQRRQVIQRLLTRSHAEAKQKAIPQLWPKISNTLNTNQKSDNQKKTYSWTQTMLKHSLPRVKIGSLLYTLWKTSGNSDSLWKHDSEKNGLCYTSLEQKIRHQLKKTHMETWLVQALSEVVYPVLNLRSYLAGRSELAPVTIRHLIHSQGKSEVKWLESSFMKATQVPIVSHGSHQMKHSSGHRHGGRLV